jgi:prolyl-tRNA editing enzyme YbaK/EbsC (Cys-tRNA(Pro) deacylase)
LSADSVRAWIAAHAPDLEFIEVEASTATVAEAAEALGVEPAQIAKSLAVKAGDHVFLLVTSGTARLDNAKSKAEFGARPRMLGPEDTRAVTGHPVGGVCPFDLPEGLPVYFDASLKPLGIVYPAGGSLNTSVRAPVQRLFELVGERWVDACKLPEPPVR